ncbi:hypothetical protein QQM79_01455 [Marinobacteraceae bacterium S3BR75-40.1]
MHLIRRLPIAAILVSCGLLATGAVVADDIPADLRAGLVGYALDTGDPYQALNYAQGAKGEKLDLLRARAFADLGLNTKAIASFHSVVEANGRLGPEARLELAHLALKQGDADEARQQLAAALPRLSGDKLAEALFYRAEIARQGGNLQQAAQALSKMPKSPWAAMGYFNLATAYANRESSPARPVVALRIAASMVSGEDTGLNNDLADRSRIAAGLLSLQADEPEKALNFLKKVHLDSYNASEGFYLHGLALARLDRYRPALQSWHRAVKFPLAYAGVPEAHIAMGRAYDEEGFVGQAAEAYLSANAAFEKEIVNIRKLIEDVEKKGGYEAMIEASRHSDVEWFLAESRSVTAPRLAWLMRYMESSEAQGAVRLVAEIDELISRLGESQHDLDVFQRMLQERISKVTGDRGRRTRERLQEKRHNLETRAKQLQQRYKTAIEEGNVTALASGELADRLETLKRLEAKAEDQRTAQEKEQLRRLKGLMTWEAQQQFERNQAGLDRQLARMEKQIDEMETNLGSFDRKADKAPERFQALLKRVKAGRGGIDQLLARARDYREKAASRMTDNVLAYLREQEQNMNDHLDRSKQEIAHLYEYMAVSRLQKEKQQEKASEGRK